MDNNAWMLDFIPTTVTNATGSQNVNICPKSEIAKTSVFIKVDKNRTMVEVIVNLYSLKPNPTINHIPRNNPAKEKTAASPDILFI